MARLEEVDGSRSLSSDRVRTGGGLNDEDWDVLFRYIKQSCRSFYLRAPCTATHMGLGLTASLVTMASSRLLFHPRLFAYPTWELSRGLTSFLVLSDNLAGVLHSLVSMIYAQGWLEEHLTHTRPCSRRPPSAHGLDVELRKRIKNPFLRAQVLAAICIVLLECTLSLHVKSRHAMSLKLLPFLIQPYSLFPHLHSTNKWLATFLRFDKKITLMAGTDIHPLWLTLGLAIASGPSGWKTSLKGLLTALVVAKIMHLRTDRDEPLVESVVKELKDWTEKAVAVTRRVLIRFYNA